MRPIHILMFVLLGNAAYAQKKATVFIRKYTQKDGINSYNIRRLAQDEFGFIWIGTQDGLSRFDGKNFNYYTLSAEPLHRICGADVREIIVDSESHLIWTLPDNFGITAINTLTGNVIKTVPIPYSNEEDWNICMIKVREHLWIGTFAGVKLYNTSTGQFEPLPALKGDTANSVEFEVRSICRDHNGNIWVAYSGYGIAVYDGATNAIIKHIPISSLNDHLGKGSIRFYKSVESATGEMIYASNQGLRRISFDPLYTLTIDNTPSTCQPRLNTISIEYLAMSPHGILVSDDDGLVELSRDRQNFTNLQEHIGPAESQWLNAVHCIFTDRIGNTWLGCQEGLGFISNNKPPFDRVVYDRVSNLKLDHVRCIYPQPNGDLLVGLLKGLIHIDSQTGTYTWIDHIHLYHHIFQDHSGRQIVSREDSLFLLEQKKLVPITTIYPEFRGFDKCSINSHLFLADTLVLLGTENSEGILLWNPRQKKVSQFKKADPPNLLYSNIVNNVYQDGRHRVWVLSDNMIDILSSDLTKSRKLSLPYNLFFDMCEARGSYWLACYGYGLVQLDSGLRIRHVIGPRNGLASDGVYQVYPIADSQLLVTTNNGISLIHLSDLKCTNYFGADGLHSDGFEEVCGLRNGSLIYAGGLNGFTIISTSTFARNIIPPRLYFTGIETLIRGGQIDTSNLELRSLTIPADWLQTNVRFAGLNYSAPPHVRYQYRIQEKDSSWIDLGNRDFVTLIGLAPRSYTLEIRAANEDGYWSPPISLTLTFLPHWYETSWFKLLAMTIIAGLLYGFYRYRIDQFRKQQQIRSGIASDLHDDIGSLLNSTKVFSHLAKREPHKEEHFENIDETLLQATTGLRDMIWVLDNSEDTLAELMERIRKYALPVTTACGIAFEYAIHLPEKSSGITKTEKRNLLLIAKEAINNSIKYSCCHTIRVECTEDKHGRSLQIEDDGNGFDITQDPKGNGLKNMAGRAKQIHYTYELRSGIGVGTCILITKK